MVKKNVTSVDENEEVLEETTDSVVSETTESDSGIIVRDVSELRPKELPLVVTLPKDASNAQIEYAKTINGYAYQNPEKFAQKKDKLIAKLESLKNAPDPVHFGVRINDSTI